MQISVLGLGYVGAVTCGCLARDGFRVIGVDVNAEKVNTVNSGVSPIVEETIGELIAGAVASGTLRATTDVRRAVLESDVSMVSVGTPSNPNGSLSLAAVERVSQEIGAALREKEGRHLVVVRSTVLPGTVRGLVIPTLEAASGKKAGQDFGVCFNPEFLREGSSVKDYYDPPFTLIGTDVPADARQVEALYSAVEGDVRVVSIETAEMVKYVCNTFHALKIAFANEVGVIARACGVDGREVMDIVCQDTKLNISPRYLRPGFAFGGSCLPKDLRALTYRAKEADVEAPVMGAIIESNHAHVARGIAAILRHGKRRVSILGITFKAGTDDLRESPLVELTERLIGKGLDLKVFDEYVTLSRLIGSNKAYIEREIAHISSLMTHTLAEAVAHAEVLVIGQRSPALKGLASLCRPGQVVVDLVGLAELERLSGIAYEGIAW